MIHIVAELGHGEFTLTVTGHEGDADGRVCAAVTAITQTALLGLQAYSELQPDHIHCTITEKEGTS